MIRVLVTGGENIGVTGLSNAIFRWGQAFDHERLVYDYLMLKWLPDKTYLESIQRTGGYICKNPYMHKQHGMLASALWMFQTFRNRRDQILHINARWSYEAFPLIFLARLAGMKKIAVHSHSSYVDSNRPWIRRLKVMAHYFFRPYVRLRAGLQLACSGEAAGWMFGKSALRSKTWKKVYNSVDLERYRYDADARKRLRRDLGLQEKTLLLGSIGRLSYTKNYEFLLDVMTELLKIRPDAMLLLIGEGVGHTMLAEKAKKLGLGNKVIFAGSRRDADKLLSAMDVFALPSRYEGLPLVLIEAQATQLPCIVSDRVTRECRLTDSMLYLKTENAALWADSILKLAKEQHDRTLSLKAGEYEESAAAKGLQNLFEQYAALQ